MPKRNHATRGKEVRTVVRFEGYIASRLVNEWEIKHDESHKYHLFVNGSINHTDSELWYINTKLFDRIKDFCNYENANTITIKGC